LDLTDEESDRRDVWILDLEQNLRIRFTTNEAEDGAPFWSADGAWIYFMSDRDGRPRLWKKRAGSPDSDPEPVMEHEEKMFYPNSLSGDGRHLTYSLPDPSWDIWAVELDQADPVKRLLKGTSAQEGWNAVSPDGKWLAYTSNRSGRMELYLAPFDDPDNWQKAVSRSGSTTVKWDSTGDRLFYSDPTDQLERRIWSVDISVVNGAVTLDEPREFVTLPGNAWIWDLDSAGERVLFVARERSGNGSEAMGADGEHCVVHVVSNFFTVLNQKAPAGTN
jgi:dipeptidyl aminopeptidase/acylaminoacyl peptidase